MKSNTGYSYCLNSSTIRDCGLSVEEEVKVAARAGYEGIELWLAEIDGYLKNGGNLAELKAILKEHGLRLPNIIAFFQWANPDEEVRKKELKEARRVLEIARELDCPYVAAPPAGITEMAGMPLEEIAGYYRELTNVAAETGVKPLLEFWGHSKVLGSLEDAMRVLEIVADPEAVLLGDIFHMAKTEDSFELLSKLDGKTLGLFHVNDYPDSPDITKLGDDKRVYPGDGVAPLGQINATLKKIGYSGILSLELFNKEYQKDGADSVAKTGIEKMKAVFEG